MQPKDGVELLVEEVPEDANNFDVSNEHHVFSWQYPVQYRPNEIDAESLPPGNYSFIATTKTITEEQAAELVKRWYYNYSKTYDFWDYVNGFYTMKSSRNSLFSFLRSQGLDPGNKVYAILKNNKS